MVQREGANFSNVDQTLSLGSQAWNVADGYTKIKILRHLVQLDRYENIALYGADDMDELLLEESSLSKRREEALKRVISTLRQLLGNVQFALKKEDKEKIEEYGKDINFVESIVDGVSVTEENMVTHETVFRINEEHFKNCIKILQRVKDEINFPINNAGLIFRGSDEVDLDKITNEIIHGG